MVRGPPPAGEDASFGSQQKLVRVESVVGAANTHGCLCDREEARCAPRVHFNLSTRRDGCGVHRLQPHLLVGGSPAKLPTASTPPHPGMGRLNFGCPREPATTSIELDQRPRPVTATSAARDQGRPRSGRVSRSRRSDAATCASRCRGPCIRPRRTPDRQTERPSGSRSSSVWLFAGKKWRESERTRRRAAPRAAGARATSPATAAAPRSCGRVLEALEAVEAPRRLT